MKPILFSICVTFICAMLLPATLVAQPSSVLFPKDSLRIMRHADSVVQNAPFIFRGSEISQKTVRGEDDQVIAVYQLQVIEVVKGNISIGDTVEVSFSLGWAFWRDSINFTFPRHGYHPDIYLGNPSFPRYYFGKMQENKPYFENSKKSFVLFSERPFSMCTYENGLYFSKIHFNKDYEFFNYMNKLLTPKEIVKPKINKKAKKQSKKMDSKTSGIEYLPAKTLTVSAGDSTANLSTYNANQDGWYPFNISFSKIGTEVSYLRSIYFEIKYDTLYFPTNVANDIAKIQITRSNNGFNDCSGNLFYTQSVTNVARNKIGITFKLKSVPPCSFPNPFRFGFGQSGGVIVYSMKLKALNSAITCMPSVGSVSNVNAVYDNVTVMNAPFTTDTTKYLIQYIGTRFRTATPAVALCVQLIDSLNFTPRTIRAGTNEVLTIKAYGKDATGAPVVVPWFGASRGSLGNVQFRDANQSLGYVDKIDNADVVWGANELKVKIPSLYLDDPFSKNGCAASGLFRVTTSTGDTATSKKRLHIEYAVTNYADNNLKKRIYLANQKCRNKYPLRCDTSFSYSYRQCVWAAARAWNTKLGYEALQIDTSTITYASNPDTLSLCTVRKKKPWGTPPPGKIFLAVTKHKNEYGEAQGTQNLIYNSGFDIRFHPTRIYNNQFQTDIPTLTNGNYVFANTLSLSSFYVAILHELGHGLGIDHCIDANHNDADPDLDAELMYWEDQQPGLQPAVAPNPPVVIPRPPAVRRTLTSGNGESLKGVQRVFNDSKTINWASAFFAPFTDSLPTLSLTQVGLPANRKVCGYGNTGSVAVQLTNNYPNNRIPKYTWQYKYTSQPASDNYISISSSLTFTPQNAILTLKNNLSTTPSYKNINNMVLRCKVDANSCEVLSDTVIFKASANVVLKPTESKCLNLSYTDPTWSLPFIPTPADGVITAYNTSNNLLRSSIDTIVGSSKYYLKKWKFATPSTYKIIYTTPLASYCPANTITTDSTWFSTFADCTTLNATNQKLYINEVYKDQTPFRNGGITPNDPCKTMQLNFSAFGKFSIGDKIKVKLSDINGNIDMTAANLTQRIIGTYTFTAADTAKTAKTDSIPLSFTNGVISAPGTKYRVQLFLERTGIAVTQWSDKNLEKLNFTTSATCSIGGGGPCAGCGSGTRTAPTQFAADEIQLYPNPTTDHFTLQTPEYDNATEVMIVNTQGQIIDKQQIFDTTNEIQTHEMPNGVYYVRIAQGQRSTTLKLVVIK
jgi:Secretion system C-terminal sorting domain